MKFNEILLSEVGELVYGIYMYLSLNIFLARFIDLIMSSDYHGKFPGSHIEY